MTSRIKLFLVLAFMCFIGIQATNQVNLPERNVLVIGIDGLRGDALMSAHTPNLDKFMNTGEYSFDADMGTKTNSASSWTNILTGVWSKKHNVKDEEFKKHLLTDYPHFFTHLKDDIRTASVINYETITSQIDCCSDIMLNSKNDEMVTEKAIELIKNDKSDLIIANLHELNEIGHKNGFGASVAEYAAQIQTVDKYFAKLLASVMEHAKSKNEEWMILITSDHGGEGKASDGMHKLQHVRYVPQIMAFVKKNGKVSIDLSDFYVNMNDAAAVGVAPTVMDYLGADKPAYFDGTSYLQPVEAAGY